MRVLRMFKNISEQNYMNDPKQVDKFERDILMESLLST